MAIPSDGLIQRLKKSEGFRARPYLCSEGRVTIGYGHNLEANPDSISLWSGNAADLTRTGQLKGEMLLKRLDAVGIVWVEDKAAEQLREDVKCAIRSLRRECPQYERLIAQGEDVRAEVLVDMCFNMGWRKLKGFRNMLAALDFDDYTRAAEEMLDSLWARQVKGRARELAKVMRTGEA